MMLAVLAPSTVKSQMTCNDLIQVSLDENCIFRVNLDMLLEAPPADTTCLIIRVTDPQGNVVPGGVFDASHRDMTLDYSVIDTCVNNSCWGQILVEDKLPPQFDCDPFDTVWCSNTNYILPMDQVFEACGTFERIIESDVAVDFPCDSACAGMRYITYYYVDESGNKSDVCIKEICYRRASLSDIVFPKDTIFDCIDFVDAHPSRTGVPQVDTFDIFPDANFCEVNCDYTDQVINVCPGTRKILRKWTCYDWCAPTGPENPTITWQVIKVLDEDGPVVYCPTTDAVRDTIGTNPWACTGDTELPEPHVLLPGQPIVDSSAVYIISECSEVSYSVRHVAAESPDDCTPARGALPTSNNVRFNPSSERWEAFDLPLGCNWFYYTFTDECGNSSECVFDIYVEDDVPPVAVCDHFTTVTLGADGTARVWAATFDDGSLDNCGIDSMDVRRMDTACVSNADQFGPYVEFCCQDVDRPIMVVFRVFDEAGNSNICMVEVDVQDKEAPKMIPPPNITVDCRFDFDTSDLSVFGKVTVDEEWRKPIIIKDPNYAPDNFAGIDGLAWDNCQDIIIDEDATFDLVCGVGEIRRTFTAVDREGLKVSRVQIITFVDVDTFGFNDIKWPQDVTMTGCVGIDTDTSKTGVPEYLNVGCAHLAATFKDLVFDQVPDACYKIERRWTVVDWCAFDLGRPVWQWDYTQIIKVTDMEKPFFLSCNDTTFCDDAAYLDNGQCIGSVDMSPNVGDACTPTELLRLRYRIDPFDTGNYGPWTPGDRVTGDYPVGTHRIEWEVEDGCGNSERCNYTFEVKDCKAPTPYCRNGIVTVLMEGAGSIEVWASDLDIGSFDNCTDTANLIFSFSEDIKETSRTYTCDSMQGQLKIQKTVRIYVTDECGNQDFCETIIELQDNDRCTGSLVRLDGRVRDELGRPVPSVAVDLLHIASGDVAYSTETDAQGRYIFDRVVKDRGYVVKPSLDIEPLEGVSVKDLSLIQRDLLGIDLMRTPYKVFAADANNNQDVSASDISEIRKLILGRIANYSRNTSWRFVASDYLMPDVREPWGAPEQIDLVWVDDDMTDLDFVGMKTGDVDNSVELGLDGNTTRSERDYTMVYDIEDEGQGVYTITFYPDVDGLGALQGTMDFGTGVELIDVESGRMVIDESNFGDQDMSEGRISFAWSALDGENEEEESLFSLTVYAGSLTNISWSGDIAEALAYDVDLDEMNVQLDKRERIPNAFSLMQNIPNPFSNSTIIGFELPRAQDFTMSFYDPNGRMLKVIKGFGSEGLNQVRVSQSDFPSNSGSMIFYQLDTEDQSATRKLIMLK
jgi:hypothetical protein